MLRQSIREEDKTITNILFTLQQNPQTHEIETDRFGWINKQFNEYSWRFKSSSVSSERIAGHKIRRPMEDCQSTRNKPHITDIDRKRSRS